MDDLISRQAAIDIIEDYPHGDWNIETMEDMVGKIKQLPPAQPEKRTEERTETHACDSISRQAAIATAIKAAVDWHKLANPQYSIAYCIGEAMRQLPPAQPEPHWIPVEQDTPTEDDDYWCTFDAETGRFVDWCSWYKGQWVVWINGSPNPVSNVIAWCTPMAPYKGVTE